MSFSFFSTRATTLEIISSFFNFSFWTPFKYNILLSLPPPVIPISVEAASPGPLTTHPIIDNVKGVLIWDSFSSSFFTTSITSNPWRAQEGHEMIFTPLFLKFKDFRISFPTLISSTGSSERDTLKVSPIPSSNKLPKPIEVFMLPGK